MNRRGAKGAPLPRQLYATEFRYHGEALVAFSFDRESFLPPSRLSGAEREVLEHVVAGKSNREIACARGVSPSTIANQVHAIFRKLSVSSRAELVSKVRSESQNKV